MRLIKYGVTFLSALLLFGYNAMAQYVDLNGNNPDINEYIKSSADNWNRPIFYVFYNTNFACESCPRTIEMIYQIYQNNYSDCCSIFEINYSDDFPMETAYDLTQPLSIVVVRINDGLARGYYKIDNPQNWISDPFYMKENITTQINNFLLQ